MRDLVTVVTLLFAACSSDPESAAAPAEVVSCESDARIKPYVSGLTVSDNEIVVTLVEADPAPPARGTNVWKVTATDSAGAALRDATLTVTAFMPDHGHGTSVTPQIDSSGDGTWTVSQLTLFMPGVWRVAFAVTKAGTATEVAFFFCVAG